VGRRPAAAQNFKVRGALTVNGQTTTASLSSTSINVPGPNITIGGNGITGNNSAGNLHIDPTNGTDGRLYLGLFNGNGTVFGNGAGGGVASVSKTGAGSFTSLAVSGNATISGTLSGRVVGGAMTECNPSSQGYYGCPNAWGAGGCTGTCAGFTCSRGTPRTVNSGSCYVAALGGIGYCYSTLCIE